MIVSNHPSLDLVRTNSMYLGSSKIFFVFESFIFTSLMFDSLYYKLEKGRVKSNSNESDSYWREYEVTGGV